MSRGDVRPSELECFLEVQGASAAHVEEVATALAEELEAWLQAQPAEDRNEREVALELARQLRMMGWLVAVDPDNSPSAMDHLEGLVGRAVDLLTPLTHSGPRRKITPPAPLPLATLWGAEDDEQTVVRKAKWDVARSTNRALKKDGSDPPPSHE